MADLLDVSEDFFRTVDIPILRGRAFERADAASESRAAVVNKIFADTFFEGAEPLGQTLRVSEHTDCVIVVSMAVTTASATAAVVSTTRSAVSATLGATRRTRPVASSAALRSPRPSVRAAVTRLNRAIPVENLSTQSQLLAASITPERLLSTLGGVLAFLGVGLSGMGLYALLAFMVTRRTSEIGVRLALGARRIDIARRVTVSALRLAGIGLLIGIPAALALSRILQSVLFGVEPHDPFTLIAAVLLVLSLAAWAAWIPARRAARVDPVIALRAE